MPALRAIVADEQALFAEVLSEALNLLSVVNVIARTADGVRLVELVRQHRPDVVIMDAQLPRTHGLQVVRTIRREAPEVKVVILAAPHLEEHLFEAIQAGVDGYLIKTTSSIRELNGALQAVARGERYISPLSLQRALDARTVGQARPHPANGKEAQLSSRERQILQSLARGLSTKEIARDSGVSHSTVRNHISRMYQKLKVQTRAALVVYAVRAGLLDQFLTGAEPRPG